MAYLSQQALEGMGFRRLGRNVKISDKASIYDCDKIEIGDNSRIDDFCVVSGRVEIGRFCHITPMCLVAGGRLGVFLDDFCGLAYGAKVFSQTDDYSGATMTNSNVPAKYKKETFSRVTMGKHAIVGTGSVVMPGVDIAEGCSVGAMSLVTKSTEAWGVYFGSPAKKIKNRKKDLLELERQFLEELYQSDQF
ncbi:acyltransferase [Halomonas piscis]|uniref:Chloramphenicol acetyltransferase n=1 Tax=Halomonas piscis TaxID=3031727 RepID=A0ABY9YZ03_9GAMM|nr:acyltransferase [Halomonas piscis]WNK20099.1 acyltransferase [Halomonas piscis]